MKQLSGSAQQKSVQKNSQNSQENSCARASFLQLQPLEHLLYRTHLVYEHMRRLRRSSCYQSNSEW